MRSLATLTLVAFGATYMAMVFADRAGVVPYAILGVVLFGLVGFSWAMCERTRAKPVQSNLGFAHGDDCPT